MSHEIKVDMSKRILVVDDDEVLRYSMLKALKRFEFELFESESAQMTQQIINQQSKLQKPINWVVLDLRLGADSGLSLARWILHYDDKIKIVIITGYASVSTAVKAIKLGAQNYLIKPVSVEEIINAFESDEIITNPCIATSPMSPKRLEWEHIQKVLLAHDGNISQAARALKMHRRTLQRKLQKKPVKD